MRSAGTSPRARDTLSCSRRSSRSVQQMQPFCIDTSFSSACTDGHLAGISFSTELSLVVGVQHLDDLPFLQQRHTPTPTFGAFKVGVTAIPAPSEETAGKLGEKFRRYFVKESGINVC